MLPGPFRGRDRARVGITGTKPYQAIPCYEIINPNYVTNGFGISDPKAFMPRVGTKAYRRFLQGIRPDVIHIHSLMGLHREFLAVAKKQGIPIVFTTHDYFGLCPKIDYYRINNDPEGSRPECFPKGSRPDCDAESEAEWRTNRGINCSSEGQTNHGINCSASDWKACGSCCQNAYPLTKLRIEQSGIYRWYRSRVELTRFVHRMLGVYRWLRSQISKAKAPTAQKLHPAQEPNRQPIQRPQPAQEPHQIAQRLPAHASDDSPRRPPANEKAYESLRLYYRWMFSKIDCFLFNSTQTRKVYEGVLGELPGEIVPVLTHGITDKRRKKTPGKILQIGYIGAQTEEKGFYYLLAELDRLYKEKTNFRLHTYFPNPGVSREYLISHPPFSQEEVDRVYDSLDLVIVPSLWRETFGLVAAEALSHGVPVLVSENVGSKDLLAGIGLEDCIFTPRTGELQRKLHGVLAQKDRQLITQWDQRILDWKYDLDPDTAWKVIDEYYSTLRGFRKKTLATVQ